MPPFWQLGPTYWINPAYIVDVTDDTTATPPTLWVLMGATEVGGASHSVEPHQLGLEGEAREKLLAYLARETETVPPVLE